MKIGEKRKPGNLDGNISLSNTGKTESVLIYSLGNRRTGVEKEDNFQRMYMQNKILIIHYER